MAPQQIIVMSIRAVHSAARPMKKRPSKSPHADTRPTVFSNGVELLRETQGVLKAVTSRLQIVALAILVSLGVATFRDKVDWSVVVILLVFFGGVIVLVFLLTKHGRGVARSTKELLSSEITFLNHSTAETLLRIYQDALAFNIIGEFQRVLDEIHEKGRPFEANRFKENIWTIIEAHRQRLLHFHVPQEGAIVNLLAPFTKEHCDQLIEARVESMMANQDYTTLQRFQLLLELLRNTQREVRESANLELKRVFRRTPG